jgi:hypothetical protein
MYRNCATANCIVCGKPAVNFHGHVIGRERMALGNYVDVKIIAGFCKEHDGTIKSDANGYYGKYDNKKHGFIPDIFKWQRENHGFECENRKDGKCSTRDYGMNQYKHPCYQCCYGCDHAVNMDCTFVCSKVAEHYYPEEE